MPAVRPGRSLFRLFVLPVIGLVLAAVVANVAFAAFLAARQALAAARAQEERVAKTLETSRVPLSPQVLETLRKLTGCEFIVWNPSADSMTSADTASAGAAALATLPAELLADHPPATLARAAGRDIVLAGQRYHVGTAVSGSIRGESLLVLTPVRSLVWTTLEAIWPALAVAAATLAVLVPVGLVATARLARRIVAIERHVAHIAEGHFGARLTAAAGRASGDDDIGRLVAGVNDLSTTLAELRTSLAAGERQRLLGQLAAGFAHELRNAITGARLAIDLHRRRCPGSNAGLADDSLTVATRQLAILEEEVRGLLALGQPGLSGHHAAPEPLDLAAVVAEVRDLIGPRAEHAGVTVACDVPGDLTPLSGRREALRAAVVNLALNAIDAAGRGGHVWLTARVVGNGIDLSVEDDGPGPPADLAATLTEPFVTGKAEGIGLGLAVAKAVAEEHAGRLSWTRHEGRTRFTITVPGPAPPAPLVEREP
jgi:signal transduction histidine kinase